MRDHDLALAIAYALAPSIAVRIYAHDLELIEEDPGNFVASTPEEIMLPAVMVHSQSEALAGSASVARATVEIAIESQSDDDSSATHSQRVATVAETMRNQAALVDGCAKDGRVQLLGRPCVIDTNPEIEQRAFRTVLTYRIGYAAAV